MSGLVPHRLLYTFMAWTGANLPVRLSQAEGSLKSYAEEDIAPRMQ
jgi:hypothetical protein